MMPFFKKSIAAIVLFIAGYSQLVNAQLATYPMATGSANPTAGTALLSATSPNVTAGTMLYGAHMGNSHNSNGYRVKQDGTSDPWPTSPTDGFYFDIPLSPKPGFDYTLTGITANINNQANTPTLIVHPFFQMDGTGAWIPLASGTNVTASTPSISFTTNDRFYNGHTYVIRFYIYGLPGSGKNQEFRLRDLVFQGTTSAASVAPTVTTLTAVVSALLPQYAGTATGSYSDGAGFYLAMSAGMVWSTSPNPTIALPTRSTDGTAGAINTSINGLAAGTTYYVRAYVETRLGVFYGATLSFTTAPPSIPTLVTNPATNILSTRATSGGSSIDSGGLVISEKGLVWSTSPNPQVNSYPGGNKAIYPIGYSSNYSDLMKLLTPNTTYYVRAYAKNSLGIGYGNQIQFTTAAPAPSLTAVPGILDFGENLYNATPIVLNYILTGSNLIPASGSITVTAPAPFKVSLTGATSSFASTVTVPYTAGQIINIPVFVQLPTNAYGSFNGTIIHSGGSVSAAESDTVHLSGTIVQSPDDVTNLGTDFWLGFGYQEKMSKKAGDAGEAKMSVYIAAGDQPANVVVELPGIPGAPTFPRTITIPANSITEVTGFPTGDSNDEMNPTGMPDTRLYYTGVSNRGVHVYTTNGAPVAVWLYTYANNNSASGAMVFPTSTWNSSYTVQAYGNKSNVGGAPNSFFFVIANENNTEVIFTPTQDIVDSSSATIFSDGHTAANVLYKAGGNYGNADTVVLNRGQVFNAMGFVSGSGSNSALGLDLSGTAIRTNCTSGKKIAVFGGNGRCLVTTPTACTAPSSGSDNLIQQMIPQVAWGTKYFTVPTKTMETNLFRIYKQDASSATTLWINDPGHTAGIVVPAGTLYYVKESREPMMIESDKPINVTQFIIAGSCATSGGASTTGLNGYGDPEMIMLSAAQQAINKVAVFSPNFKNTTTVSGSYVNVIIKSGGISSFRLDPATNPTQMVDTGSSSYTANSYGSAALIPIANAFKPFVADPTYSWAKFKVATGTSHFLQSDSGFNAIAYGMGGGESYGFNAGTAVKNLNCIKFSVNPNGTDSSAGAVRTCVNNPVRLRIALPYNPFLVDSIEWYPENAADPRISPNTRNVGEIDPNTGKAKYISSFVVDGRTFYVYESPVIYQFSALGTYRIIANAHGTFASDCPGQDAQKVPVIVGRDYINFTYSALCGNPTVQFTNNSLPMAGTTIQSILWEFGDNSSSSSTTNPLSHTYAAGNQTLFNVKLTTNNSVGCISTDSVTVDISGGIRPRFTIAPRDTACAGATLSFDPATSSVTGATSGTPVKYTWNFGEGSDVVINGATSPVQTHQYNTAGRFEVILKLETSNGCIGVYKDTVVIEATPVAAINPQPATVCLGTSASFQDASTISIGNLGGWSWTFDGTATSTLQNPTYTFLTSGNHTVTLTVTSTSGCPSANTASRTIHVDDLPTPGFRYDLNCTTRTLTITDTSNGHGVTITSWNWDFGDGATSTLQNPSHVYAASGTYTITLNVTTVNGCTNAVPFTKTVTIAASPVADFTLPGNTCLPGASPAFLNTTTISDGTIGSVTYTWNFGDGSADLQSPPNPVSPTHIFPGTGPYSVVLTATSINGCTNSKTRVYSSIYQPAVASIASVNPICAGGTVNFSSTASTAPGSSITGWNWTFGDGNSSTVQNPTHTYATAGTKEVILTVTTAAGCTSAPDTIYVDVNALPTAAFTDTINCSSRSVGFSDQSVPNSGTITGWSWNFGDAATSTQQNPTHVYSNEGNYTVTLSVTTDKGCTSATPASHVITIAARPVADFNLPGNICLPNAAALFTNTTTISDGTAGSITYSWDFGDASAILTTPPAPVSPTHTYTAVGPFSVTLQATSNQGCVHRTTKTYNAVFATPVAVITAPTGVCLGNSASFGSASSSAPASSVTGWSWNFGDGGTANTASPTHTYNSGGPKTVTLTVTSAVGCTSAPVTSSINVNLSPVAAFNVPAIRCKDSVISFTDASIPNASSITEWNWTFGDGGTLLQNAQAPAVHTYSGAQSYTVTLSVKNSNGCINAAPATRTVVINPNPLSLFTPPSVCIPTGVANFVQQATISSGTIRNYAWDFGLTGATGTGASTNFSYTTGGQYNVSLTVTSDSGCVASKTLPVKVFNAPAPAFSILHPDTLCVDQAVRFVNESVVNGYGAVDSLRIYWDLSGTANQYTLLTTPALNATSDHNYPLFGFPATKNIQIKIRVYNGPGCYAETSKNIVLQAKPTAQLTQPAPVCQEANAFILSGGSELNNLPGTGVYSGNGVGTGALFNPAVAGSGTHPIRYTFTSTAGCSNYTEKNLVVNPTPVISFVPSTINVLEGDALILKPTITNGGTYLWSPATYLNAVSLANPTSLPLDDINYQVLVTSPKGCSATGSVSVNVVKKYIVPNTFTPNHDNIHDTWHIENLSLYPDVRVRVFNRSGQLVFESMGYLKEWDGTYKGKDCPFGTYYYVIETGGGRAPKTGYVTIIR